jgi:hypothetical protein
MLIFSSHSNFSLQIVFNYINDKDTFELFYQKFLSKRLINQQSISDDYEEMIISKLKVRLSHYRFLSYIFIFSKYVVGAIHQN